ncbi:hypothetical protein Hanom_Chr15g01339121 [Helianthus anomalus]
MVVPTQLILEVSMVKFAVFKFEFASFSFTQLMELINVWYLIFSYRYVGFFCVFLTEISVHFESIIHLKSCLLRPGSRPFYEI